MLRHDKQLLQHEQHMLGHDRKLLQHAKHMLGLDQQLLIHAVRMKLQALCCRRPVKQLLQHLSRLHGPSERQPVRDSD